MDKTTVELTQYLVTGIAHTQRRPATCEELIERAIRLYMHVADTAPCSSSDHDVVPEDEVERALRLLALVREHGGRLMLLGPEDDRGDRPGGEGRVVVVL